MSQQNFKQKNVLLKFEEIDSNEIYAFTFNPCDKFQHFKSGQRLNECLKDMDSLFYSLTVYSLELYPELSPSGRFHLHGFIQIHDTVGWCLYHSHHLTNRGTLNIKKMSNIDEWLKYCLKQGVFHLHMQNQTYNKIPYKKGINKEMHNKNEPGELTEAFGVSL